MRSCPVRNIGGGGRFVPVFRRSFKVIFRSAEPFVRARRIARLQRRQRDRFCIQIPLHRRNIGRESPQPPLYWLPSIPRRYEPNFRREACSASTRCASARALRSSSDRTSLSRTGSDALTAVASERA